MATNLGCHFGGAFCGTFVIIIVAYVQPVLADAGDDFSNNLFSDLGISLPVPAHSFTIAFTLLELTWVGSLLTALPHKAPLITLFGEQVAKQYLSQSMYWLEHVIFACAPLGIITAITCAIRVTGSRKLKAIIGRARETDAQAEIEIMRFVAPSSCCYL
jgi:hypothetical protein